MNDRSEESATAGLFDTAKGMTSTDVSPITNKEQEMHDRRFDEDAVKKAVKGHGVGRESAAGEWAGKDCSEGEAQLVCWAED